MKQLNLELNDFAFEDDLINQPYNVKKWLKYIQSKDKMNSLIRYTLYERAIVYMPGSYKLWHRYLMERMFECSGLAITDRRVVETNNVFVRSLTFMHKMPKIWMMYGEFLTWQRFITVTRKTFDRALISLPITQHHLIWPLYLKFVKRIKVSETAIRIYRRFIQLNPHCMEDYVKFLEKFHYWDEATKCYLWMINEDKFVSKEKKTKLYFWKQLCNLICEHSSGIISIDVNSVIRSGIRRYPQEIGYLWNLLATYYIRSSLFECAYDIFEEGINSVTTVRDFKLIYESYTEFQNKLIQIKLDLWQEQEKEIQKQGDDAIFDISSPIDLDILMDRLEIFQTNRDLLLSNVRLRQNPNNISEWLNRVRIYIKKGEFNEAADVFATACNSINPDKVNGRYCHLWITFAKFYEEYDKESNSLQNARDIYKMAVKKEYKKINELSLIWCEWAEMELKHKKYEHARQIIKKAAKFPTSKQRTSKKIKDNLWKSTRMWCFLADLEESMGTLVEIRKVYNTMLKLKVSTLKCVINYANILWNHNYYEDAFRVYERGLSIFPHPHVMTIWFTYIKRFLERYSNERLERLRELFEHAIVSCPSGPNKQLYLMYARLEEKRGSARKAMRIYEDAVKNVLKEDQVEIYLIYLKRAADLFGIIRCREIFEKAIQNLPDINLPEFSIRYVNLEQQLGEIDRARGIFIYGSQFADPEQYQLFWRNWESFEVDHGNEETFREMLRTKRNVISLSTKSCILFTFLTEKMFLL